MLIRIYGSLGPGHILVLFMVVRTCVLSDTMMQVTEKLRIFGKVYGGNILITINVILGPGHILFLFMVVRTQGYSLTIYNRHSMCLRSF